MNWFQRFCRNVGLMVHNVQHPDGAQENQATQREQVSKTVEEERAGNITLRRTTIEEIEIQAPDRQGSRQSDQTEAK